ncbi:MAG: hypothetical protein U9N87_15045, partial [Planctomycetota bacterium]|nr:hypothetical protein [Planctomycetota bacterium]
MCDHCLKNLNRREFVATGTAALGAVSLAGMAASAAEPKNPMPAREKKPAVVKVVFLYPRPEDCDAGKAEASWQEHNWHPYPGNQFRHDEQRDKFAKKIGEMAKRIGLRVEIHPGHLDTTAKAKAYAAKIKPQKPDVVLAVSLSDPCHIRAFNIIKEVGVPGIMYVPTGADHQLPPENFRKTPGLHFIYSIENWDEIERSLRAVHAKKMLGQSRMLRVFGGKNSQSTDKLLGFETVVIPAAEYNDLFDSIKPDEAMKNQAMAYKKTASRIMDVTDHYIIDGFRAHKVVETLLTRYGGDAITINCLHLRHRKPCISFSINNGQLTPCGCENDLVATLTMMLGTHLFGRGGFQHNPGYDMTRNRYFATHCTCATKLHGPKGDAQELLIRPFFHHLPKTAALDVQWTPQSPALLMKYAYTNGPLVHAWTGKVIESPKSPPTGGCATRVLVEFDDVDDIATVYPGSHPVLYSVSPMEARALKIFAKLYKVKLAGNIS